MLYLVNRILVVRLLGLLLAANSTLPSKAQFEGIVDLLLWNDTVETQDPNHALQYGQFVPVAEGILNFPVSSDIKWLRFKVDKGVAPKKTILSVPYAEIDEFDLFSRTEAGLSLIAHTGRLVPSAEQVPGPRFYDFELNGLEGTEYLLRVGGFKPIHLPLQLNSPADAMQATSRRNGYMGLYAGIMLAMALYNLFVYLSIRDKSYLFYVLYIIAISTAQLTFLVQDPFGMWSGSPWFDARSSIFFALAAIALGVLFAQRFIGTKTTTPRLHRVGHIFYLLIAINLIIYSTTDPRIGYQIAQALGGWSAIYLFITALVAQRSGSRQASYFLIAWSAFLIGVVVFVLKDAGVLPFNDLTQYAMPIGSAIEGILLSFGLADRINVLRKEKERSQAEALSMAQENERLIREQNIELERKVHERTAALQESNDTLKRTQAQLVQSEKMSSLGQLTAGIAHEINNPINFISSNIGPLRRNVGEVMEAIQAYRSIPASGEAATALAARREHDNRIGLDETITELDEIIHSMDEGARRTAEIVRGLRNFSRLDEDDLKPSDLNEGLRSTMAVLMPQYRDKVDLRIEAGEIPKAECFPGKINQVLMNILNNAAQATLARADGRPREVTASTTASGQHVVIRISDTGVGMSDEVMARMYDPFFTTKPVGEGTGLGLAIVYGIINEHNGSITVESQPGIGTTFTITLPIRQPRAREQAA
ncbi:MAG: GHKL domain-containing protein [Flavobacteriales bacterium]|nr:GHKL domain-containing protein [Flavobacteriales bacterium]